MVKTESQIKAEIEAIERANEHILHREIETIETNAPVALMQIAAESKLRALYWTLGKVYQSTLTKSERLRVL